MKMSPIQKYAMRLLIANGKIQPPEPAAWQRMSGEIAEACLRPLGGIRAILETLPLPGRKPSPARQPNVIPVNSRRKSELER